MHLRSSSAIAALSAALLVSSTAPARQGQRDHSAETLAKALAGRTAGAPVGCISERARMQVIDDRTLLFRDRGTIYVQRPRGGCYGLSSNMSLIRNQVGSLRLCRGDINRVVDVRTGFGSGSCVFGEFVPYRRPG